MSRTASAFIASAWLMFSALGRGFGIEVPARPLPPSTQAAEEPDEWWEINILLTSKGKYTYKQCQSSYKGHYSYAIRWTGCMEQDEEDFILYHEYWDLLDWEPQEKKEYAEKTRIMEARDISAKPCFTLNYILTHEEKLVFDFLVKGIEVPQNCSKGKVRLHFPASKENSRIFSDIDYDLYVHKGSNQVAIAKTALLEERAKKSFHWTWQHQKWFDSVKKDPHLYQSHDVEVEVSIVRHRE